MRVSEQLALEGNYSGAEQLDSIILHCREQLKDWLTPSYEENIALLLGFSSFYEDMNEALSRAKLLEKTLNIMKPDECRLPETIEKLFGAYKDSCRELALSRTELLEKTINLMEPDEYRLPETIKKLFDAYKDFCRELALSRANLLGKIINLMKPDEYRLPATIEKLFDAYNDSYRELASLGNSQIKTPLLLAVEFGNPGVVSFILEKEEGRYYIQTRDISGQTAMSLAVASDATEIVRILIGKGAMHELDQPYSDGTPLEIATREDSFGCFRLLFDLGVGTDKFLFAAIQHDRVQMVIWLLEEEVNIHAIMWCSAFRSQLTPMGMAILLKRLSTAKLLLERGVDLGDSVGVTGIYRGHSALACAASIGDREMVNMLIARGAPIDGTELDQKHCPKPHTPLCRAIAGGFTDMAILLLEKGVNPNVPSPPGPEDFTEYPLLLTCDRDLCDLFLVKKLLEKGADVDGFACTRPILMACQRANEELVRLLLENGANANLLSVERRGFWSALQEACADGFDEIVEMLLENGADVNLRWRGTLSALTLACATRNRLVVQRLLINGADVNTDLGARLRYTPLRAAAQSGDIWVGKLLLYHGAVVHTGVLSYAATLGHREMVELLLDAGADVNEPAYPDVPWSGPVIDWMDNPGTMLPPELKNDIRCLLIQYGAKATTELGHQTG